MVEEKDDHGLGLSLSLGCTRASMPSPENQPCLKLNLMSFPSQTIQNCHPKSSFGYLFQSSAAERNPDARSFLRKIDMNRVPLVADCDDEAGMSSPNSTISSLSGKRSEREQIGEENEAERTSCCRGSDDEDGGAGDASRKKLRLSKEQSLLLEETFKDHNTLNPKQKLALAKQLNLRPRQVEVWFQNRRARTKLKQTEVDCEYLKRCCENLTEENRRLQKEVQELRALKLSPQLYMHINPPTTLTMCPACERVAVSSSSASAASLAPTAATSHHRSGQNHNRSIPMNPWASIPIRQRTADTSAPRS